ncbi:MAG: carboxypeptidase regulatory-like domain-containing protein [Acidobacteria bacterium]|jgi:hypothetical protein|nr:carboxypeptidase regulatory-like domain-containing protein [Acidobacteriota bacterium]
MKRFSYLAGIFLLLTAAAWAQDELSLVTFTVLKDHNGKPLRNAAVVLHPVDEKGKQERGGLELKTDADGKTSFDGVPYGKLRIQVLAPGYQTFGEDYSIDNPTKDIVVRMKRPAQQYSIYEDHPDHKPQDKKEDDSKPDDKPKQ